MAAGSGSGSGSVDSSLLISGGSGEFGREVDGKLRYSFSIAMQAFSASQTLENAGAPLFEIQNPDSLAQPLMQFLMQPLHTSDGTLNCYFKISKSIISRAKIRILISNSEFRNHNIKAGISYVM
jgi:hypothetical protein